MTTETVQLLPCPFCGGKSCVTKGHATKQVWAHGGFWRVYCGSCQARQLFHKTEKDAIKAWNTRPIAQPASAEPVAQAERCRHQWLDNGEHLLVCTACGVQEDHDPRWQDMATAPRDGTMLRLLVEFSEHSTEDEDQAPTIGANNAENDGEDRWQFAGWCWSHDHFTEGNGTPVGWLPLLDAPPAAQVNQGLVEALQIARLFIRNGIELGFIRMPDADTPDPAHDTLPMIDAALAAAEGGA
jgi:Lar family restriction alleviation protein